MKSWICWRSSSGRSRDASGRNGRDSVLGAVVVVEHLEPRLNLRVTTRLDIWVGAVRRKPVGPRREGLRVDRVRRAEVVNRLAASERRVGGLRRRRVVREERRDLRFVLAEVVEDRVELAQERLTWASSGVVSFRKSSSAGRPFRETVINSSKSRKNAFRSGASPASEMSVGDSSRAAGRSCVTSGLVSLANWVSRSVVTRDSSRKVGKMRKVSASSASRLAVASNRRFELTISCWSWPCRSVRAAKTSPVVADGEILIAGGESAVVDLRFESGDYGFFCFVPDRAGGPPHAVKGMVTTATVP